MRQFNYKFLALKIWQICNKKGKNFASWEEIGRPFQDCYCLDLREKGILALSSDGGKTSQTGVMFRDRYVPEMTMAQFHEYIKQLL